MKIIDVPQSILDLMTSLDQGHAPWPLPESLAKPLKPVMKFDDAKLLPPILHEFCIDVAHRMQCPIDFVAVSVICMLGSVIGTGCAVRPKQKDDWTEVPNLWGGVVGRPGKLKTPALDAGMAPLRTLESDATTVFVAESAAYETDLLGRKLEEDFLMKSAKKAAGLSAKDIDRLMELRQPPADAPRVRRYKTNDGTVEKLGDILSVNSRGLLVFRDELVGLLTSFDQQGHESDRGFYLEAWNGRHSYRVDRIGRGEICIPRLCLSLFGGIQPAKLQDYLYQTKVGGNDGFLQRFQLLVYPNEIDNPKFIDEEPNRSAAEIVIKIVRSLANADFTALGAKKDSDEGIPYLRFEKTNAQKRFNAWYIALDKRTPAEDDPIIQEHLAKYRGLVPSLALIFHLFECAGAKSKKIPSITVRSMKLAIAWAEYLETHARRIYSMGTDIGILAAGTLANKLKAQELADGFSERDVQRRGWANLTENELVRSACQELEAAGWIRRQLAKKRIVAGRPPSVMYDINPKLWQK